MNFSGQNAPLFWKDLHKFASLSSYRPIVLRKTPLSTVKVPGVTWGGLCDSGNIWRSRGEVGWRFGELSPALSGRPGTSWETAATGDQKGGFRTPRIVTCGSHGDAVWHVTGVTQERDVPSLTEARMGTCADQPRGELRPDGRLVSLWLRSQPHEEG